MERRMKSLREFGLTRDKSSERRRDNLKNRNSKKYSHKNNSRKTISSSVESSILCVQRL